ncbi:hypothetical protein Y900_011880 [Mycolicibacterium aromaticivorans JS19b1 = JCM 16368]|uniref:DUF5666 domain-containing protein n=1 Tax=Mycolicibacterium aromaticivorans JS19b1 = JCM 16368 TaxID=1440774 RepID=A0A064CG72_9MYCO|nr:hypothetical protein [Mycolicibacterium aromaticivorans]KDE99619.1 hypothetical protein Y900_011880 [Mycolicibacterium aromaticivorans JS19b1 = JCM 16368]
MSVEQQPMWGAPAEHPKTWSNRTTAAAIGIAAALAVVGGVVVYAAAGSAGGHGGGPPGWGPGGPGGSQRSLHGESVVSDGKGGFSTELTQTGAVTAASDTSVTVRSQDGFNQTYVLNTDTRKPPQPLQTGTQVSVRATELDGAATATMVMPAR